MIYLTHISHIYPLLASIPVISSLILLYKSTLCQYSMLLLHYYTLIDFMIYVTGLLAYRHGNRSVSIRISMTHWISNLLTFHYILIVVMPILMLIKMYICILSYFQTIVIHPSMLLNITTLLLLLHFMYTQTPL